MPCASLSRGRREGIDKMGARRVRSTSMAIIKKPRSSGQSTDEHADTSRGPDARAGETPTLSVSREKVCQIVFKAREFDVKDLPTVTDDASNPADDGERSVLEDRPDDPAVRELAAFIS